MRAEDIVCVPRQKRCPTETRFYEKREKVNFDKTAANLGLAETCFTYPVVTRNKQSFR